MPLYEIPCATNQHAYLTQRAMSVDAHIDPTPSSPDQGLSDHLRLCQCRPAFSHGLHCACSSASCFIAARLFTSVTLLSIAASAIIWLFGPAPLP